MTNGAEIVTAETPGEYTQLIWDGYVAMGEGPIPAGGGVTPPATTTTKGTIRLGGDLGGTADLPTVLSGANHDHTAAQISDSTATGRDVLKAADKDAARTAIDAAKANGITEIRKLTQAQYNALGGVTSATTLYVIVG